MSGPTLADKINSLHAIFDNYIQHHHGVAIDGTVAKKALKGAIFTFMDGEKIRNFFVEEVVGNRSRPEMVVRYGEFEMIVPPGVKTNSRTYPYVKKMERFSVTGLKQLGGLGADLYRILMLHSKPGANAYLVASLKFDYSDLAHLAGSNFTGRPKMYNYQHEPKENPNGETQS